MRQQVAEYEGALLCGKHTSASAEDEQICSHGSLVSASCEERDNRDDTDSEHPLTKVFACDRQVIAATGKE